MGEGKPEGRAEGEGGGDGSKKKGSGKRKRGGGEEGVRASSADGGAAAATAAAGGGSPMQTFVQILGTETGDTCPSVLIVAQNCRYMINVGDGIQVRWPADDSSILRPFDLSATA